jgi:hypothetical protein
VADVFAHGVVITAMHSHARRDEDFGVDFDGIPDSTDFSFRPEPGSRPVMAGTLPARVTSTTENDTYGHIDKDGRYRVNMLFDRDNWETGFESLWVRQSRRMPATPTACTCRCWRAPKWRLALRTVTRTGRTFRRAARLGARRPRHHPQLQT